MKRKPRRTFSNEDKQSAVSQYLSGSKSAASVAAEFGVEVGLLYKWRVQLDEKAKGARAEELESMGHSKTEARKIQALEDEINEYKKKVAEQSLIIDLLKKLQTSRSSQPESELSGLIRTSKNSGRKNVPWR